MGGASDGERRIVLLEWDRGHESLVAIVHAESPAGLVISHIEDLCELQGRRWIRADEVVHMEDLEPDDPARRLAVLRGSLTGGADAEPTDLDALLSTLHDSAALVAIYTARTGSDECLVGSLQSIGTGSAVLTEVSPGGTIRREPLVIPLEEIIAIDWGTDYLGALAELTRSSIATDG